MELSSQTLSSRHHHHGPRSVDVEGEISYDSSHCSTPPCTPTKELPLHYSLLMSRYPQTSLAAMLSPHQRGPFPGIQTSIFAARMASKRNSVSFEQELEEHDGDVSSTGTAFSQAEAAPSSPPRPAKKRRFERRNSQTAAMLRNTLESRESLDDLVGISEKEKITSGKEEHHCDPWAGGLAIAEDLVQQIKFRRAPTAVKRRLIQCQTSTNACPPHNL